MLYLRHYKKPAWRAKVSGHEKVLLLMLSKIFVPTLLDYLPTNSLGLSTSLIGRSIFVIFATVNSLALLRLQPLNFLPHALLFISAIIAIWIFGSRFFLRRRATFMLLVACSFIGTINGFFPNHVGSDGAIPQIEFGLTRGFAFAGLSFSTLLAAVLTRPSDLARLLLRFLPSWYGFLLGAIPFASINRLASQFSDIVLTARARNARMPGHASIRLLVVNVSAALLATTLRLSLHLYHVGMTARPHIHQGAYFRENVHAPIVTKSDLLLALVLVPNFCAAYIII